MPLYFYVNKHLVKPSLTGWYDNVMNVVYSQDLAITGPPGCSAGPLWARNWRVSVYPTGAMFSAPTRNRHPPTFGQHGATKIHATGKQVAV